MSIIICKHCSNHIDTDFDAEHEEICLEEQTETTREKVEAETNADLARDAEEMYIPNAS